MGQQPFGLDVDERFGKINSEADPNAQNLMVNKDDN